MKKLKKIVKKAIRIILTPFVIIDYFRYIKSGLSSRFLLRVNDFYPQILDKTIKTGFERHYIYHTAWAARKVKEINPEYHVDISSSLYFCGIVSAFIHVKFYDYRPAELVLSGLSSDHADLTKLPFADNSQLSLSCMHTVEHVGLGRYGDPFDADGDLKAMAELERVLAPGGSLLFVVPVGGKAMIEFNAHRIYTPDLIKEYFKVLKLKEFALIPENNGPMMINPDNNSWINEKYACGCFWFTK